MRPAVALAAVVLIGAAAVVMKAGGRTLPPERSVAPSASSEGAGPPATAAATVSPPAVLRPEAVAPARDPATGLARSVAPDVVVPPPLDGALERAEPREPLSKLSLALPPEPVAPADWEGTILYRPVATGSARFDAMGRSVAVAGTENVAPDERCTYADTDWACGIRARTAFRALIRGRAVVCAVPPDAERGIIVADCRIGKQQLGVWLVTNGWARAVPGGPYADAEKQAREAKRGIFGPPPEALE